MHGLRVMRNRPFRARALPDAEPARTLEFCVSVSFSIILLWKYWFIKFSIGILRLYSYLYLFIYLYLSTFILCIFDKAVKSQNYEL